MPAFEPKKKRVGTEPVKNEYNVTNVTMASTHTEELKKRKEKKEIMLVQDCCYVLLSADDRHSCPGPPTAD